MELIDVLRHNNAYNLIKSDMEHNMLSHSYLIVGDDPWVIDTFIELIELLVYCDTHSACMQCMECRKVLDGNNTNIYHVVSANGKDIKVDEISAMIEDTYIAPYEDNYKVYTIARGETMNVQSQNKLLKTLEEPVGKKLILIGTTNESNMLDTIKSRCKKLYISPFTFDEAVSVIDTDREPSEVMRTFKLSGGKLSLMRDMLASNGSLATEYDKVVDMLLHLKSSRDLPAVVGMMDKKINGESGREFLSMLEVVLRDTLTGSNTCLALIGYNARSIANIEDLVSGARERLNFNASAQAVLDYVLFGILEVKYKCR